MILSAIPIKICQGENDFSTTGPRCSAVSLVSILSELKKSAYVNNYKAGLNLRKGLKWKTNHK